MSGHLLVGGSATQTPAIDMPALPDELTPEQEAESERLLVAYVLRLVGCAAALGFVLGFSFQKLI